MKEDQSGFIKGRYIKENKGKVMNIVNKAQSEEKPRILLFLDAEKAYDMIKWQYIHQIDQ